MCGQEAGQLWLKQMRDTAQDGSGLCSYMLGFVCGMSCVRTEWR